MIPAVHSLNHKPWLRNAARVAIAAIGLVAVSLSAAEAGGRHHGHYYRGGNDWGGAAAAGVIGLAAGAIIGSAFSGPGYYAGAPYYGGPVYYDPPPYRYLPPPYPYRSEAYVGPPRYDPPRYYQPRAYRPVQWSPEWIAYCARKYKSFNPRTGTYRTYSGRVRMCH